MREENFCDVGIYCVVYYGLNCRCVVSYFIFNSGSQGIVRLFYVCYFSRYVVDFCQIVLLSYEMEELSKLSLEVCYEKCCCLFWVFIFDLLSILQV